MNNPATRRRAQRALPSLQMRHWRIPRALGLNICWEAIYALNGISHPSLQAVANTIWAGCDVLIVATYVRFAKNMLPEGERANFALRTLAVFGTCLVLQLSLFLSFDNYVEAAQYSAFLQNVAMSILFVAMLRERGSSQGQTMLIAVAKYVGTLAPTIQQGIVQELNIFILMAGALCFAWDVAYIVMLRKTKLREAASGE